MEVRNVRMRMRGKRIFPSFNDQRAAFAKFPPHCMYRKDAARKARKKDRKRERESGEREKERKRKYMRERE